MNNFLKGKGAHVVAALFAVTLLGFNWSYLADQYTPKATSKNVPANTEPAGTMRMMIVPVSEPGVTTPPTEEVQDFSDFVAKEKLAVTVFLASIFILLLNISLIANKQTGKYLKMITWGVTGIILTPAILYYSLFV